MSYINLENISYSYPLSDKKSLENINLHIEKGEIILITGKSGSGKSTLVRCITGTIPNFYGGKVLGNIKINNKNLEDLNHRERAKEITMVFQDPERQLIMNKVHREIAFSLENLEIKDGDIKRRVWETMRFFNISNLWDREIETLSGGEKQKVVISSAIVLKPNCIILDEPISQLDPQSAEEVIYFIKKINEELGITILIIEQRIDKWFEIADKILIMEDGKSIFYGNRKQLYNKDLNEYLPIYLRANKLFKKDISLNIKDTRKMIEETDFSKFKNNEDNGNNQVNSKEKTQKNNFLKKLFSNKKNEENPLISVDKLFLKYNEKEVLKNINLNFKEGEFYTIIGENGAGKSTLLKALMNLIKFKGDIFFKNKSIKNMSRKDIAKIIGYVSQNPNDYISKDTVYEEIKFTLDNFEIKDESLIDDILKKLDIYHLKDRNPRDVSSGEKQRIAIASIMVMKPKIIMLDEPTRGLDNKTKELLGKFLRSFKEEGSTIIMVTHDIDFSSEYSDEILLMFDGNIISKGKIKEVLKDGIYYTSTIHKLFKDKCDIYSFKELEEVLNEVIR